MFFLQDFYVGGSHNVAMTTSQMFSGRGGSVLVLFRWGAGLLRGLLIGDQGYERFLMNSLDLATSVPAHVWSRC